MHDAVPAANSVSGVTPLGAAAPRGTEAAHSRPLALTSEQIRSAIVISNDVIAALARERASRAQSGGVPSLAEEVTSTPLPEVPEDLHALFCRVDGVGASNDDIAAALDKIADSQRRQQSGGNVSDAEREALQLQLRALACRVRGLRQSINDLSSFLIARDVVCNAAAAVLSRCAAAVAATERSILTDCGVRREALVSSRGRAWVAMQSARRLFPREEFDFDRELSGLPFLSTAGELHQRVLAITASSPSLAPEASASAAPPPDTIAAGFAELRRISAMTTALASDLRTAGAQATARDEASVQRYRQAVDAMQSAARLVVKDDEEEDNGGGGGDRTVRRTF